MNCPIIYKPAYMVWPIIAIHGHHGYFGEEHVKGHCQTKQLNNY